MSQTTNDTALGGAFGGDDEGLVQTNPEVEASQNPTTTKTITDENALGGAFGSEESPLAQSLSGEAQSSADAAQVSEEAALASEQAAATSETNAATSESNAAQSSTEAFTSATNAATSETNAATSAATATTKANEASASATQADASAANTSTSEINAATSEANAAQSELDAETSATSATSSAVAAQSSATSASSSATAASTSAANAATSETNAASSATASANSAAASANSATQASTSASQAATSETNAAGSASNAATSETNAATSETNAATSETNAATSETNAATSESNAADSASQASGSAIAAATSETNAAASATAAATSETNASTSETNASTSATNASTSATNAATSETNAATSEGNASASETNASNSASAASTSEINAGVSEVNAASSAASASTSATNAATSETNAASSASAASLSASAAATSEINASTSEANAATSETNAGVSEVNAFTSESNASTSEFNAATSETNAAGSATAAASSANTASTKANEASLSAGDASVSATQSAGSATSSASSASAASLSEGNAATSETNAATSEVNASTSESNAASSAISASGSATSAASSASAAASSATNASTSETNAANSATSAANSASSASNSAAIATSALDQFEDIYLGAKSSEPTLDNDGNTLQVGALFFDTSGNDLKIWTGTTWTLVLVDADLQGLINDAIANLVDSAPTTLDTLNELAAALGDDPNFATTVSNSIGNLQTQINTLSSNKYESGDDINVNSVTLPNMVSGLTYDSNEQAIKVQMLNNMHVHLGQDTIRKVYNGTTSVIPKGTVVGIVGVVNNEISIAPYIADGTFLPGQIGGVAAENISPGTTGFTVTFGCVEDFDTSALTEGAFLYASDTVVGGYSQVAPTAPSLKVIVGIVTESSATTGSIVVRTDFSPLASDVSYDNAVSELVSSSVQGALDELQQNKASIDLLSSNITLFPTTATSPDVTGHNRLVTSKADSDYDDTAVNVSTGSIGTSETLVGELASDDNIIEGSIAGITVTLIGNIEKLTGNANQGSHFYFKIYRRESDGTEHLMGESFHTETIYETDGYEQFSSSVYLSDSGLSTFTLTDRIVLRFYGVSDNTATSYQFQFGGSAPIRSIVPVPVSVIPSRSAEETPTDTSSFGNKLSGANTNVQSALDTLDDHGHSIAEVSGLQTSLDAKLTATSASYNNTNWDTAYSWGDHGQVGYLTSIPSEYLTQTEGDTLYLPIDAITLPDQTGHSGQFLTTNGTTADWATVDTSNGDTAFSWGNHANAGYSTTDTTYSIGDGGLTEKNFTTALKTKLDGIATNANNYVLPFTNNSTNWNTAYSWGDHASAGYLTSLPAHVHTIANITGLQTELNSKVDDSQVLTNVPSGAVFTDTVYSHPTYAGDDFSVDTGPLTGATVVSDIDINVTTDGLGHVTDANGVVSTRTLTLANLGYTGATNANNYSHPSTHPATMITTTDEFTYSNSSNVQDVLDDLDQAIANVNAKDPVLTLNGDVTGTATFTNLGNATLTATVVNDSHTHDTRYVIEGGTSFSGEYPVNVRTGTRTIYSDNNIRFRGSDSRLSVDGSILIASNTAWHAGNDGSGSGLDADLLDGKHASEFALAHSHPYLRSDIVDTLCDTKSSGTLMSRNGFNDFIGYNPSYGSYIGGGVGNASNYLYSGGYISKGGIHTLWHSGNDGSGSGLDADLLDGLHASSFYRSNNPSGFTTFSNTSSEHITYRYRIHASDSTSPDSFGDSNRYQTFNYGVSSGVVGPLISFGGLGTNYPMQLTGHYSSGGSLFKMRTRNGDANSWNSWRTIWHDGNDGSGSGLDADLLDGQHGSYYAPASHSHSYLPLSGGTLTGGLTISGSLSRGTYPSASQYHTGADNIVLKGNSSGISSIFFESEKDGTNINHPSDFGFIQYHAYGTSTSGESNELIIGVSNDADDHVIVNAPNVNGFKFRTGASATDYTVWHAGNFTPSSYATSGHSHSLTLSGDVSGSGSVSGTISVTVNNDSHSHSNYLLTTGKAADSNLLDGIDSGSFLRSDATDYLNGVMYVRADIRNETAYRDHGVYGHYDSTKTNHIWSMGSAYRSSASGANFGNLYGLAYKHTNNATGGTMGGSHQMVWCNNGSSRGAIGYDRVWHASGMRVGSSDVWHGANDGSGSGLDADLLDGQQGSYYLPTTGKAADSNLLDGVDISRVVHGNGVNRTDGGDPNTLRPSGFYENYQGNSPTSTWYNYINMRHTNAGNGHGHQIAGSFYSAGDIYNRSYSGSGTFTGWARLWNTANDGSGSGLDADLLDGQHASAFLGVSAKAADSNLLDGLDLHTGRNNEANKVVRTDGSGYIQAGWINTTSGLTTGTGRIYASNDSYLRYVTNDTFRNNLGLWWSGNDGSGSGLDADLLDGQHASAFASASHSHSYLPLTGGTITGGLTSSGYNTVSFYAASFAALLVNSKTVKAVEDYAAGAVGSYCWAMEMGNNKTARNMGATLSGSLLRPSSINMNNAAGVSTTKIERGVVAFPGTDDNSTLSGTWRLMSAYSDYYLQNDYTVALWLRIA